MAKRTNSGLRFCSLTFLIAVLLVGCQPSSYKSILGSYVPRLILRGQTYNWESVPQISSIPVSYSYAGELAWIQEEIEYPGELEISSEVEIFGSAYYSDSTPDVVYIKATTDWLSEAWVRFVIPIMNFACIGYAGELYTVPPEENTVGLKTLPEGFSLAGELKTCAKDMLPEEDFAVTWERFVGNALYTSPDHPELVYMEAVRSNIAGDTTIYIPSAKVNQP